MSSHQNYERGAGALPDAGRKLLKMSIERTRSHINDVGSGKFVGVARGVGKEFSFTAAYLAEESYRLMALMRKEAGIRDGEEH